jgi:hypothetical protein
MFLVANLDKNRERGKSRVFAQTVPVDIKKLIHSRGLAHRLRSGKLAAVN